MRYLTNVTALSGFCEIYLRQSYHVYCGLRVRRVPSGRKTAQLRRIFCRPALRYLSRTDNVSNNKYYNVMTRVDVSQDVCTRRRSRLAWAPAPGERIPHAIRLILRPQRGDPRELRPVDINTGRRISLLPFKLRKLRTLDIHRQRVNIAIAKRSSFKGRMKQLLLAMILLSIAMPESILMQNNERSTIWIRDKQFWHRKTKRIPQNNINPELFSNYNDDTQLPQVSNMQIINKPTKLPTATIIRQPDLAHSLKIGLLSIDKSKCTQPTLLISIGIQEGINVDDRTQEECLIKKNRRKHNNGWQLQQPFYVEEPKLIEIDADYTDGISSQFLNTGDPYILSRGKKVFRIKNGEQLNKIIKNYEEFLDYRNDKNLPINNRIKRFVETNKKSQNNVILNEDNQEQTLFSNNFLEYTGKDTNNIAPNKMQNRSRKSSKNSMYRKVKSIKSNPVPTTTTYFIKNVKKDQIKNMTQILPYKGKWNRTSVHDLSNANFIKKGEQIMNENISDDIKNNINKIIKIGQDKIFNNRKSSAEWRNPKVYWVNADSEENFENKNTDILAQIKNNIAVENIKDSNTNHINKNLDNKYINHNESVKKQEDILTIKYHVRNKRFEDVDKVKNKNNKLRINTYDKGKEAPQLTDKSDLNSYEITSPYSLYRKKRNICGELDCENGSEFQQGEWLKNIEKNIQKSSYMERRDKHGDILDIFDEPFIISRGKKASHELKNDPYSLTKPRNKDISNIVKMINLPIVKSLLETLFMGRRCKNDNCSINSMEKPSKRKLPRDRRYSLDEILVKYDPYYVVRGKRLYPANFVTKMRLLRNQRFVAFTSDDMQNDRT